MLKSADNIVSSRRGLLRTGTRAHDGGLAKSVLTIVLIAAVALAAIGCEDFGRPVPSPTPEEPERRVTASSPRTADRAVMAVYEHLLKAAESHEAKRYLAEFYGVSDNWSAEKELLKDGSSIWHITIDITASEQLPEKPHWQQAGWFVLQDGRVIPSHRFQANALRIEADLQELSLAPDR